MANLRRAAILRIAYATPFSPDITPLAISPAIADAPFALTLIRHYT
jgi:hypothetical protein